MKSLKDKIAVITGAGKGIGRSIAAALGTHGCRLVLASRNEQDLKKAVRELSRVEVKAISVPTDVRKMDDVENLAKRTLEAFGPPDILINNAGIGRFAEVRSMTEEDFQAIIETNLYGTFYCCKTFLPSMIQNGAGHIINISSLAGKNPFASGSAYCASKAALNSFAECLMLEVRHHNIKVSTICPGTVQTNFSPMVKDRTWGLTSDDVAGAVLDLLCTTPGSLISMVDLRPLKPPRK